MDESRSDVDPNGDKMEETEPQTETAQDQPVEDSQPDSGDKETTNADFEELIDPKEIKPAIIDDAEQTDLGAGRHKEEGSLH